MEASARELEAVYYSDKCSNVHAFWTESWYRISNTNTDTWNIHVLCNATKNTKLFSC